MISLGVFEVSGKDWIDIEEDSVMKQKEFQRYSKLGRPRERRTSVTEFHSPATLKIKNK